MNDFTVAIPTNFTDAGKLLGMFEIRNAIEALILCVPAAWFSVAVLPFPVFTRITAAAVLVCVLGGFSLIGIGDHSLMQFFRIYIAYRKERRILTYRGIGNEKH